MLKRIIYLSVLWAWIVGIAPLKATEEPWPTTWLTAEKVVLQGLDKVTARVFTATVFPNQLVRFGTLEIYIRAGFKAPPEEMPESVSYLEVFENKPGESRRVVFSGWMFASTPTAHAFEHPVYDIWIKEAIAEPPITNDPTPTD